MPLRLLLLGALVWVVVKLWQGWLKQKSLQQKKPQDAFEPMARCAGCGVYLPANSLSATGKCGKCSD